MRGPRRPARLDAAMAAELAPLKMERAVFATEIAAGDAGPEGRDAVQFTVATNPGAPAGPLNRIASGGELSRFLLALKVCLTAGSSGSRSSSTRSTGAWAARRPMRWAGGSPRWPRRAGAGRHAFAAGRRAWGASLAGGEVCLGRRDDEPGRAARFRGRGGRDRADAVGRYRDDEARGAARALLAG
jgi:hypothetical protein